MGSNFGACSGAGCISRLSVAVNAIEGRPICIAAVSGELLVGCKSVRRTQADAVVWSAECQSKHLRLHLQVHFTFVSVCLSVCVVVQAGMAT